MKNKAIIAVAMVATLLGLANTVWAQWSQESACPGWNNPTNFGAEYLDLSTGDTKNAWSGQTGVAIEQVPNVYTKATGATLNSSLYVGTNLNNATYSGYGSSLPSSNRQFYIHTSNGTDPNTNNRLPYIPSAEYNTNDTGGIVNTNLTSSIRVGDGQSGAQAAALYYEFTPSSDNAIFAIYYAVVVEGPEHGTSGDPSFVIRVMEKNASNQWVQKSDTLAYYVTSTCANCATQDGTHGSVVTVPISQKGWHAGITGFKYKDWDKIVVNLTDCIDQLIRVEVIIRDCPYSAHTSYGYLCGECRSMDIKQTGCPAGLSTDVTTLQAPRGMKEYEWSASEYGQSSSVVDLEPGRPNDYFTFRTLASGTAADGMQDYRVQADDFRVIYRPNDAHEQIAAPADSVGQKQSFRCRMKSALNPDKPFWSSLYVNVTNTKPSMKVDTVLDCNSGLTIWNLSEVPGAPNLAQRSQSTYKFYNNPIADGEPYETLNGDTVEYTFTNQTLQSVLVRTVTTDPTCYSEAIYPIQPRHRPQPAISLSKRTLCDAEQVTITDASNEGTYRTWRMLTDDSPVGDGATYQTVVGNSATENKSITRPFNHSVEPIELTVGNGMYVIDTTSGDTVWCESTTTDTVRVFLHPELRVTGETIVCDGEKTRARVEAVGVDGCTYEWSRTNGSITGGLGASDSLIVVPYADQAKYYVRVTSPQGCVAWDSINVYLVRPRLTIEPPDGRICPGQEAVIIGHDADHYTWQASPNDLSLASQDSLDTIRVRPTSNTTYTMYGYGSNGCQATPKTVNVTLLPLPVPAVDLTPGYIDVDDPQVLLRDVSQYGVNAEWAFEDGYTAFGREVQHLFEGVTDKDSVMVTLTTYNSLNCGVDYDFSIPVRLFTAWFPNVFTPGSEDANAKFRLYTINEYEQFHIYIYNRQGMLVFDSTDPEFEWDGTYNGQPCEQGAYVYICHYRKPNTPTLSSLKGTLTLLR